MPKGPQGQKRPTDVIGCAVHVAKIARGEVEDNVSDGTRGAIGGRARVAAFSAEVRSAIATDAA